MAVQGKDVSLDKQFPTFPKHTVPEVQEGIILRNVGNRVHNPEECVVTR